MASPIGGWLDSLLWLDGTPLRVEPYRRRIFEQAFFLEGGRPRYTRVLTSRAKKNAKSLDLVLAGLYSLLVRESPQGSDGYILANDEEQAGDDLDLAAKLVRVNPRLQAEVVIRAKALERRDENGVVRGVLQILPAKDVAGAHGKTAAFVGFDEIHAYRDYGLLEALSPDPTRKHVLVWITSYDSIWHTPGRPLWDMLQRGKRGEDPRMLFSWYSGDFCTDPDFKDLPPEQRANPSMGAWENPEYLEEQRRRLPSARYRRLHLNLGGQPEGAAYDALKIEQAVDAGVSVRPFVEGLPYFAFVDMSGGSKDDAALAIAHREEKRVLVDLVQDQGPRPPFDPREAVRRFATTLRDYGLSSVHGDAYAGLTFRKDFEDEGIEYRVESQSASALYEALEPVLNAGELALPDSPKLSEQLVGLIWKGGKITHVSGEHDDLANAVAGVSVLLRDHGVAGTEVLPWSIPKSEAQRPSMWSSLEAELREEDDEGEALAALEASRGSRRRPVRFGY